LGTRGGNLSEERVFVSHDAEARVFDFVLDQSKVDLMTAALISSRLRAMIRPTVIGDDEPAAGCERIENVLQHGLLRTHHAGVSHGVVPAPAPTSATHRPGAPSCAPACIASKAM
jgi:hypothetical protein